MTTNNGIFFEGHSVVRPSMFNGSNYVSWKEKMIIFLQSIDIELWFIISEGPYDASLIDENTHRSRPKIISELTAMDRAHLTLNAKP